MLLVLSADWAGQPDPGIEGRKKWRALSKMAWAKSHSRLKDLKIDNDEPSSSSFPFSWKYEAALLLFFLNYTANFLEKITRQIGLL